MAIDPTQALIVGASLIGGKSLGGSDATKPNVPSIGYQGGIPDIKYVREQVPISNLVPGTGEVRAGGDGFDYVYGGSLKDPSLQGRRPGSYGRRYFTDGRYEGQMNPYTGGGIGGIGGTGGTGGTGGGINASDITGGALLGYGAYKALGGSSITEGAKNLLLGSGAASAGANAAVTAGSNLVPGTGVVKAGGDGFSYVYGGSLKNPALQGMTQQQIAAQAGGKTAASKGIFSGLKGSGLAGKGFMATVKGLANIYAPVLAGFGGSIVLGNVIADALGFGNAEKEKRAAVQKALEDSGFFATNEAIKSVTGKSPNKYIEESQKVLQRSPYKMSTADLQYTDDGRLEEEAISKYYSQDPRGKAKMARYYAENPEYFAPDGTRRYPDDAYGDIARAQAAYNATSPYPQGGIGISPMLKINQMAKDGTLSSAMRDRESFYDIITADIGTPGASSQGIGSITTDEVSNTEDGISNTGGEIFTPLYSPEVLAMMDYNEAQKTRGMAEGGIVSNAEKTNGFYLGGITDGMSDEVDATVDGEEDVMLSDGEFVIPADVVSHLGNGNSDAGAKQLKEMMDEVRMDRTGTSRQGKEINPDNYLNKLV